MPESGLPFAISIPNNGSNNVFGNLPVKDNVPTESYEQVKKGLRNLEKAAKEKVFAANEPSE